MPDRAAQPSVPTDARAAILAWYAERGRPFAFRETSDPYAILVSEAMAQQTQIARAAASWERFMERFPTVEALAAASPADVLRAWAGLGYDRRALALWRTARVIVTEHGGHVPATVHELEALPGVGRYTARAVAALAYGLPVGAVDVNVRRVLGRIVAGDADALSIGAMQAVADAAVPADEPGIWTHAVMDVGATVCKPRAPRCETCPAAPWCRYAGGERLDRGADPRRPTRARERSVPFTGTNRWLRGRILGLARAAPDGAWVALDAPIGDHDLGQVRAAALALVGDGVLEVRRHGEATLRVRLPLA